MFDLYIQIYTISLFTWELQTSARKIARTTTPCFYSAREWTQNLLHARKPFYQLNYVLISKIKFLDTNNFPVILSFVKDFWILREVPGSVSQSTV